MGYSQYIDHTCLKPTALVSDIENLCREAIKNKFFSVCVNPYYVKLAKEILRDTSVSVCAVVGFPLGQNTLETKLFETAQCLSNGADEIDYVVNISTILENDFEYIKKEAESIKNMCVNRTIKAIIEIAYLNDQQILNACDALILGGADFVKTSTGFAPSGDRKSTRLNSSH